ncbi:MAG TPA: RsiV family protein [Candidatus Obscuribacterales bacterium]
MPRAISIWSLTMLLIIVAAGGSPLFPAAHAEESANQSSPSSSLKWKSSKISERRKTYSVDIDIPKFEETDPDVAAVNSEIRKIALKAMNETIKDFHQFRTHSKSPDDNSFNCTTEVKLAQPNLISVTFSLGEESIDLPHGSHWNQTLNYQLHPLKKLTLDSIFLPKSGYLTKLAELSRADLTKQLQGDGFNKEKMIEGTNPKTPSNFKNFALTKQGLYFDFNQDQVANYEAGDQEVTIPWSKLKTMLSPDTPVYKLSQQGK